MSKYLWTKRCFLMEGSSHKITVLSSGNPTLSMNTNAAWMANNLTNHVLCNLVLWLFLNRKQCVGFATNWPFCYIIWPFIWMNTCRRITESKGQQSILWNQNWFWLFLLLWIKATNGAGYPSSWTWISSRPFLPGGYCFLYKRFFLSIMRRYLLTTSIWNNIYNIDKIRQRC